MKHEIRNTTHVFLEFRIWNFEFEFIILYQFPLWHATGTYGIKPDT